MATQNIQYTVSTLAITAVTTTLAGGEWACSAEFDNSTNEYLNVLVGGTLVFGASHVEDDEIRIYPVMRHSATSTDVTAGIGTAFTISDAEKTEGTTFRQEQLGPPIAICTANAASSTVHWVGRGGIAQYFGEMPQYFGLLFHNVDATAAMGSGSTLDTIAIEYTSA